MAKRNIYEEGMKGMNSLENMLRYVATERSLNRHGFEYHSTIGDEADLFKRVTKQGFEYLVGFYDKGGFYDLRFNFGLSYDPLVKPRSGRQLDLFRDIKK